MEKKEKNWYKAKGMMLLYRGNTIIREYRYNDSYNRRRILRIWNSEIKPNGEDKYYLVIKPNIDAYIG